MTYKTGDIGFIDENMNLVVEGRLDGIVKINGKQIDLNNIAHKLSRELDIYEIYIFTINKNLKNYLCIAHHSNTDDERISDLIKSLNLSIT